MVSLPSEVLQLLFLLPGTLAILLFVRYSGLSDEYSEAEVAAFSLSGSLVLGVVVYATILAYRFATTGDIPDSIVPVVSNAEFVVALLAATFVGGVVGVVGGVVSRYRFTARTGLILDDNTTLEYAVEKATKPVDVTVETADGPTFHGTVKFLDEDANDLLLTDPMILPTAPEEPLRYAGRYMHVDGEDVQRVNVHSSIPKRGDSSVEEGKPISVSRNLHASNSSAYVRGTATNETDETTVSRLYVTAEFYDEDGVLLGTRSDDVSMLAPGRSWRFRLVYQGSNPARVADHRLRRSWLTGPSG